MDDLDLTPWEGLDAGSESGGRVAHPRAGRLLPSFGGYRTFEPIGLPPTDPPVDLGALAPRIPEGWTFVLSDGRGAVAAGSLRGGAMNARVYPLPAGS